MTVCVAVICGGNMVCGMSDRMLTAGDVQFQPSSSKIWVITRSIVMMSAGDIGLQTEIYTEVMKVVSEKVTANPTDWLRVEYVADLCRHAYFEIRRKRAEKQILLPLGLTDQTFLTSQKTMEPGLVSDLAKELIAYRLPNVAGIIAGNNPAVENPKLVSAHIFSVENGVPLCADKVGFACVGAGAWHANSTLMLAGHTPATPPAKALLNLYSAKKRAEVAPGVGVETDNFVITPSLGSYDTLRNEIAVAVVKAYDGLTKQQAKLQKRTETSLQGYINEILQPKPAEPQTADGAQPESPPNVSG
jgi:hypothetical protein